MTKVTMNRSLKAIIGSLILLSTSSASANMLSFIPESTDSDYNYVGARAGGVFPLNINGNTDLQAMSPDANYTLGFSVGRKIKDRFAVELEFMNRGESKFKDTSSAGAIVNEWSVKANTLMLNASVDIITDSAARPYVKLGVGASRNEAGEYEYSTTLNSKYWGSGLSTTLAWQAAIGGNISITKSIDANIEYAYIDRGKFRTKNGYKLVFPDGETTYESNSGSKVGYLREQAVTLGIKYKF